VSAIVERSSNTIEHLLNSQIKPTIKLIPLACFGTTVKKKSDRLSPPERRSQLIEATLICLMREGARGLSSRKICAQAQVSVGLLNHHFSSQEQLVAAAYEESSRRHHETLRARIQADAQNQDAPIKTLVSCAFEEDIMHPDQLRAWVVFWSKTIDSKMMRATHDRINERLQSYLIEVLAQSLPNSAGDLRVLAIEYSALVDGLWLDWSLNGKHQSAELWQTILNQWLDRTLALASAPVPD
jgi:TetR/AcrR family transcriptional repressor of bet genes